MCECYIKSDKCTRAYCNKNLADVIEMSSTAVMWLIEWFLSLKYQTSPCIREHGRHESLKNELLYIAIYAQRHVSEYVCNPCPTRISLHALNAERRTRDKFFPTRRCSLHSLTPTPATPLSLHLYHHVHVPAIQKGNHPLLHIFQVCALTSNNMNDPQNLPIFSLF